MSPRLEPGFRVLQTFIQTSMDIHSTPIVLKQSPGSSADAVIAEVKEKLEEIRSHPLFPPGMDFEV